MKLGELLNRLKDEKAVVFVNGIKGRIVEISDELIALETIEKRYGGKKNERVLMREITYIPVAQIWSVSTGAKEIPKPKEEIEIEKELEKALSGV